MTTDFNPLALSASEPTAGNQPALPSGPSPAAQLQAAKDARIAGRMTQQEYMSIADRLGPPLGTEQRVTHSVNDAQREDVQKQIDALKADRLAGKINDDMFHRRMGELGPLLTGETPEPQVTISKDLEQLRDEIMTGAKPEEYALEYPPLTKMEGPVLELDTGIRAMMSAAGIPKHLGSAIHSAVDQNVTRLANATPQQLEANAQSFHEQLTQAWGKEAPARLDAIQNLVVEQAKKSPWFNELLQRAPHAIDDMRVANALWTVLEHRSRIRERSNA